MLKNKFNRYNNLNNTILETRKFAHCEYIHILD